VQHISPMLWFEADAEEAANLYVSVFPDSRIESIMRYPKGAPLPEGTVATVDFTLRGQRFTALNGGPYFKFNEAISLVIHCTTQDEVDHYWEKLTADGGQESHCGWLKDKFGLSWQVTPTMLTRLNTEGEPEKVARMFAAMMTMGKLDIAALQRAYDGK